MKKPRFPVRNFGLIAEALRGTPRARSLHHSHLSRPISAEAGITEIQQRWPRLESSNASPVFILSAGWRSGSTFLQRLVMSSERLIWGEPYRHCALIESLAAQLKPFNHEWPLNNVFIDGYGGKDLTQEWVANLYPSMQTLKDAHTAYFEQLFAQPAIDMGYPGWGLKEVTLTSDHACYLKWLFPKAKFLFLYRNPFDAWRSYRRWRSWYQRWPDRPVHTATRFGQLWTSLTADYLHNHEKVGGLLLGYEDLKQPDTQANLERYLGYPIAAADSLERIGGATRQDTGKKRYLPKVERLLLARQVRPLCSKLGYTAH